MKSNNKRSEKRILSNIKKDIAKRAAMEGMIVSNIFITLGTYTNKNIDNNQPEIDGYVDEVDGDIFVVDEPVVYNSIYDIIEVGQMAQEDYPIKCWPVAYGDIYNCVGHNKFVQALPFDYIIREIQRVTQPKGRK